MPVNCLFPPGNELINLASVGVTKVKIARRRDCPYIYETSISPEPTAQVPALYEVSSITLPNSRQYTFSYLGKFGEVSSMTTPLGATTAFAYTLDGGTT